MRSLLQSGAFRLRRGLWHFRKKHLLLLLLLLAAADLVEFHALLPVASQILLWAALLVIAAWVLHGEGRSFLGPVFFYDLVRSSRRGEQVGHRCFYALMLACVIAAVYWSWFPDQGWEQLLRSRSMTISQRAQFASSFFTNFM